MQENSPQDLNTEVNNAVALNNEQVEDSIASLADEVNRIEQLEKELNQAKDQLLRSCAELSNLQRRAQEDIQNANKFAINKFAAELLSVKDSLEMALMDQSNQFESLKMGVDLTLKQLTAAFEKAKITEIMPICQDKLDPHKHQAMSTEPSEQEPNTIVRVLQKGYLVSDRVLRPALVVVAKPLETADKTEKSAN